VVTLAVVSTVRHESCVRYAYCITLLTTLRSVCRSVDQLEVRKSDPRCANDQVPVGSTVVALRVNSNRRSQTRAPRVSDGANSHFPAASAARRAK
jgi:hypothetical protein